MSHIIKLPTSHLTKLILLVLVLFSSCEESKNLEHDQFDENFQKLNTSEKIDVSQIPEITSFIKKRIGISINKQQNSIDNAYFDTENIMKVTDSIGNKNYSIPFFLVNQKETETFNLVIGEDINGNKTEPVVIKYNATEQSLRKMLKKNVKVPHFKGTIELHKFTNYFDVNSFSKLDECPPEHDANGDPIPCAEESVDSSGTGGASSGGTSSGTSGGTSSGSGGNLAVSLSCDCVGHTSRQISAGECNCSSFSLNVIDLGGVQKVEKAISECPGCDESSGSIGINFSFGTNKLRMILGPLGFNDSMAYFVESKRENNQALSKIIYNFLSSHSFSSDSKYYVINAVNRLMDNSHESFYYLVNNRTSIDKNFTGDTNNNPTGGEDLTNFSIINPTQDSWPTISTVISENDFVGWGYIGIDRNCFSYAKEQIRIKGYGLSNYFNNKGQTIQVYKQSNGANASKLALGISYLKYALENGIPVVVGVDNKDGSPNPQTDNTTDHFVVIVGMGTDSKGKFFRFFDNATNLEPYSDFGASPSNKLYYDSSNNILTGTSNSPFSLEAPREYVVTMIRKSKKIN